MDESAGSGSGHSHGSGESLQSFAPHPYQSLNVDGEIVAVNDAWLDHLEYERDEVIGCWFGEILTNESRTKFESRFDDFKSKGEVSNVEFEVRKGNGSSVIVSFDGVIEYDGQGDFVRTHCQFTDISDWKYRRTLFETSSDVIMILDENGRAKYVSPSVKRVMGYDPEELRGRTGFEDIHPDDQEQAMEVFTEAMKNPGTVVTAEYRIRDADGSWRWVEARGKSLFSEPGGEAAVINARVIDERKEYEQKLHLEKERAEQFFETAGNIFVLLDLDGDVRRINAQGSRLLGYETDELRGQDWFEAVLPEEIKADVADVFEQIAWGTLDGVEKHSNYIETKDGERRYIQWHNTAFRDPSGEIMGVLSSGIDITERKQYEERLKEQRDRLEYLESFETQVTEFSRDLIGADPETLDEDITDALASLGKIVNADRSYVFQIDHDKETQSNTHEWTADGIEPQIDNLQDISLKAVPWWIETLRNNEPVIIQDVSELPPEASAEQEILEEQNIQSLIATPITFEGTLIGFIGFDWVEKQEAWSEELINLLRISGEIIGGRLQWEERRRELKGLKERLELATEIGELGVWDWDMETGEIFRDEIWAHQLGYEKDEIGTTIGYFESLTHPEDLAEHDEALAAHKRGERPYYRCEYRLRTKSGDWKWIKNLGKIVEWDGQGNPRRAVGIHQDIDDQRRTRNKLKRNTELLQALDRVLRHNVNNDMNVISGNAELIQRNSSDEIAGRAATIIDESEKLLETVDKERQITEFLSQRHSIKTIQLGEVVDTTISTLLEQYPEAEIAVTALGPIHVEAIPRLGVAIKELLTNAIIHSDRETAKIEVDMIETEDTVTLKIADNGPGIPEMEQRIFRDKPDISPLYHGSGLGLWLVKLIIDQSNGSLDFGENEPRGTIVEIGLERPDRSDG